jgi:hypothetical protein
VVNLAAGAEFTAPGQFVRVRVVDATPHSLIGEPVLFAVKNAASPADEEGRSAQL